VQRAVREAEEEEGRLVKKRIDQEICKKNMQRRKDMPVKVILLDKRAVCWLLYLLFMHVFFCRFICH